MRREKLLEILAWIGFRILLHQEQGLFKDSYEALPEFSRTRLSERPSVGIICLLQRPYVEQHLQVAEYLDGPGSPEHVPVSLMADCCERIPYVHWVRWLIDHGRKAHAVHMVGATFGGG